MTPHTVLWARWMTTTNEALTDTAAGLARYIVRELEVRLADDAEDKHLAWLGPMTIHTSDHMTRNAVVFIAERLALRLDTPNPMPVFVPFPRVARWAAMVRRDT